MTYTFNIIKKSPRSTNQVREIMDHHDNNMFSHCDEIVISRIIDKIRNHVAYLKKTGAEISAENPLIINTIGHGFAIEVENAIKDMAKTISLPVKFDTYYL